ncbi:hypothetical protein BNJ_00232 [Kaumoebavirus]|uniref:hypothetical protein n=1 Tax=Kaumoebavirus TaxID=1859492 RepID=UPI0009C2EE7E|nr:hypothetical protein BNJ_00232 [Kaumoebavirus]ARA72061.1 hypothetical protein BNJ_00232 [Kaumoebavirus]
MIIVSAIGCRKMVKVINTLFFQMGQPDFNIFFSFLWPPIIYYPSHTMTTGGIFQIITNDGKFHLP